MQHDIQTDKQRRLDEALAPVELTADLTTAPTPTATVTRRRSSKARRNLQTTIAQIDTLFPALADKPSKQADLLCEKASAVKTLLSLEAEDRETEQDTRAKELEQQHATDTHEIAELRKQNRELQTLASTRKVVTVSDPNHAAVKEERDALQSIVALLAATLLDSVTEDARAQTAVRVAQSCKCRRVVELFCKLTHIDCGNLSGYLSYTESALSALRGSQTAKDSNVVLARAVLAVKYPAPAKPQAPVFVPDHRSGEEKLADAKKQTRQSWQ